jgi:hypothetical protein
MRGLHFSLICAANGPRVESARFVFVLRKFGTREGAGDCMCIVEDKRRVFAKLTLTHSGDDNVLSSPTQTSPVLYFRLGHIGCHLSHTTTLHVEN